MSRDVETLKWDRQEESEEEGRQVLVCCMPRPSLAWLTGISQFASHSTLRISSMTGGLMKRVVKLGRTFRAATKLRCGRGKKERCLLCRRLKENECFLQRIPSTAQIYLEVARNLEVVDVGLSVEGHNNPEGNGAKPGPQTGLFRVPG